MPNAYDLRTDEILKRIDLDIFKLPWADLMPQHKAGAAIYEQSMPDHVISVTRTPIVVRSTLPEDKEVSGCVYIINARAAQKLTVHLTSTPAGNGKSRVVMLESTTKEFLIDRSGESPVSANVKKDHIYCLFMVGNTKTTKLEYVLTLGTPTGSIEVTKEAGEHTGAFTIAVNNVEQTFDSSNTTCVWNDLQPGEYTIVESDPGPSWTKMSDIKVHVAAGQTVKLTLPNTYAELEDPSTTGSIEVTKETLDTLLSGIGGIAAKTDSISDAQTELKTSLLNMKRNLLAGDGDVALGLSFVQESVASLQQSVNMLGAASSTDAVASAPVSLPQPAIVNPATPGHVALGIQQIIDTAYKTVTGGPKPKNPAEFRQMLEKKYPVDPETGQVVRQAQHALGYGSAGLASVVPAQQNLIDLVTTATKLMEALDQLEEADEISDASKRLIKLIRINLQALQKAAGEEHPSQPLILPLVTKLTVDSSALEQNVKKEAASSRREAQLIAWANLVVTASIQFQTAFTGYWTTGVVQDPQSEATQRLQLIREDLVQLEGAYDQAGLSRAERSLEPVVVGSDQATVQSALSSINRLLEMGPDLLDAGDDGLDRLKDMAGTSVRWVGALPDLTNAMVTAARDELKGHLNSLANLP